jgi:hypothetical protein
MKIWELDDEYDSLISFVKKGREGKKHDVREAVSKIREAVLSRGDRALVDFSVAWDRWEKEHPLKVTAGEIDEAASRVSRKDLKVLKGMIRNVASYHKGQRMPKRAFRKKGLVVEEGPVPVESVMVYVPGGTASYPSSLIMGVLPAQIAGVKRIYVATPGRGGAINDHVAAAAKLLGIHEIYRIGGAQAVYAFAYGTASVPKVDMIVGPGNAFVEEAKRDVYGSVGIDMLAGPTELVILCTEAHSPGTVAIDMFSQAEHDELASVGLFSSSREHLDEVTKSIQGLLRKWNLVRYPFFYIFGGHSPYFQPFTNYVHVGGDYDGLVELLVKARFEKQGPVDDDGLIPRVCQLPHRLPQLGQNARVGDRLELPQFLRVRENSVPQFFDHHLAAGDKPAAKLPFYILVNFREGERPPGENVKVYYGNTPVFEGRGGCRLAAADDTGYADRYHMSRFLTLRAFSSIKALRFSMLFPIRTVNTWSAATASSMVTFTSFLFSGFIVVSHSWSAFISPRPLYLWMLIPSFPLSSTCLRNSSGLMTRGGLLPSVTRTPSS